MEGLSSRDVLTGLGILVTAAAPFLVGILLFVRQKEHELIVERYLRNGLDEVLAHCQHVMNIHAHNWSLALSRLRHFRDVRDELDPQKVYEGFEKIRPDLLPFSAAGRVNALTNGREVWQALQLIVAFGGRSQNFCGVELPMAMKAALEGRVAGDVSEMIEVAFTELKELNRECDEMLVMMGNISKIAISFETSSLKLSKLFAFHKSVVVLTAKAALKQDIKAIEARRAGASKPE